MSRTRALHVFGATLMLSFAGLFIAAPFMGGCAEQNARQHVVMPEVIMNVDGVSQDARAGILTMPEADRPAATANLDAFTVAIRSGTLDDMRNVAVPRWPTVRAAAQLGIARARATGAISQGLAESKSERLNQYELLLSKLGP